MVLGYSCAAAAGSAGTIAGRRSAAACSAAAGSAAAGSAAAVAAALSSFLLSGCMPSLNRALVSLISHSGSAQHHSSNRRWCHERHQSSPGYFLQGVSRESGSDETCVSHICRLLYPTTPASTGEVGGGASKIISSGHSGGAREDSFPRSRPRQSPQLPLAGFL